MTVGRFFAAALSIAVATTATAPRQASAQASVVQGLSFGTILTGTRTTVAPTDAGAAAWQIRGILGISGGVSLTLPTVLTRVGGATTMPITFCATCGVYRINNTSPVGGTAFDPAVGVQGLYIFVLSDMYVWLGASVNPPLGQQPGSYVGTAVLTISALL